MDNLAGGFQCHREISGPAQQMRNGQQVKTEGDQMPMWELWVINRLQISFKRVGSAAGTLRTLYLGFLSSSNTQLIMVF